MSVAVASESAPSSGAAYGRLLPSCFTKEQAAHAMAVSVSTVREWMKRGVLRPMEFDGTRAVFHRDEVALGFVLHAMQEVFGHTAELPFAVAEVLRPQLRALLHWDAQQAGRPIIARIVCGPLRAHVVIRPEAFDTLAQRMHEAIDG